MKRTIIFNFTKDDPNWQKEIDQAFNRVLNFAPELWLNSKEMPLKEFKASRSPELAAFNRIVMANEFSGEDVGTLNKYAVVVYERVANRYTNAPVGLDEQGAVQWKLMSNSCLQAGISLCQVMAKFTEWFATEVALPKSPA